MPKLVAMLRVKDAGGFLAPWLHAVGGLADEIVVVDNGSTDGTLEILMGHEKVTEAAQTEGFDEGRDKNLLYDLARRRDADWLLWLDVDEIPEARLTRDAAAKMMNSRWFTKYFFRRLHFVDSDHFDASRYWLWYSSVPDRLMWRDQDGGHFLNARFNNGLVRGIRGLARPTHYRLRHTGSVDQESLSRKIELYRSIDASHERMYQRIRHADAVRWTWREQTDAPLIVLGQNLLLDIMCVLCYPVKKVRRLLTKGRPRRATNQLTSDSAP